MARKHARNGAKQRSAQRLLRKHAQPAPAARRDQTSTDPIDQQLSRINSALKQLARTKGSPAIHHQWIDPASAHPPPLSETARRTRFGPSTTRPFSLHVSLLIPAAVILGLIFLLLLTTENSLTGLAGLSPEGLAPEGIFPVAGNAAPVALHEPPHWTIGLNQGAAIDLDRYFTDPDKDPMTFLATETPQLNVTITGSMLELSAIDNWTGTQEITIIASDEKDLTKLNATITVTATLSRGRQAALNALIPVEESIADQLELSDETGVIIELSLEEEKAPAFPTRSGLLENPPEQPAAKQRISYTNERILARIKTIKGNAAAIPSGGTLSPTSAVDAASPLIEVTAQHDSIPLTSVRVNAEGLKLLAETPGIKAIHADTVLGISTAESLPLISAPQAWNVTVNGTSIQGNGTAVCVLDTGIDATHPAFANKTLPGFDFADNDDNPSDDNGHGTHVAGIIVSTAPDMHIIPLRVCNQDGRCKSSDVISAIDFCINTTSRLHPTQEHGMTIPSLSGSFGDGRAHNESTCPSTIDRALYAARQAGMLPVFAAGNDGSDTGAEYPACSPYSMGVGAVKKDRSIAGFSNRGYGVDIYAPGVNINSTLPGGSGVKSGTSMAAPFVSGAAALITHYGTLTGILGGNLTPSSLENAIILGAGNETGTPILNIADSINALYPLNEELQPPTNQTPQPEQTYQILANPSAERVNITPFSPNRTTSVAGVWNYSDTDGDPENGTTYTWFVNGTEGWRDPSLVSYWRLDGDTTDLLGRNNGSLNISMTTSDSNISGLIKQSQRFNGTTFISVPSSPNLNFSAGINQTISLWFYRNNSANPQHMLGKRLGCNAENVTYQIAFDAAGGLQYGYSLGASPSGIATGIFPPNNTWHHVAAVFDGRNTTVYYDGTLANTTNTTTIGTPTDTDLQIGSSGGSIAACAPFKGTIDEVKIYNRSLTPHEIANEFQMMSYGSTEKEPQTGTPAPDIPLLLYHFEEAGNTSVFDHFGDMNGTWNGSAAEFVQGVHGTHGASFNGIHRFINISPYIDKLNFSGAATIEMWVSSSKDDCQAIFNLGNSSADASLSLGIFIGDACTGTLTNELVTVQRINESNVNSRYGFTTTSRNILLDGTLHHLALTFNTTATRIFIDGAERTVTVGSGVNDGSFTGFPALGSNRMAYIGVQEADGFWTRFNGTLDEYAIYRRALSPTEINQSFRRGFPLFGFNTSRYGPGTRLRFQVEPLEANATPGNPVNSSTVTVNPVLCGGTMTENEVLTVSPNATDTCFTIGADRIILDCNGFTIRGNGTSTLVNATGRTGLIIRNCNFINATTAIGLIDVNDTLLFNNTFTNASIRMRTNGFAETPNRNITISANNNITDADMTGTHFATIENSSIQTLSVPGANNTVRTSNITRTATIGGGNNTVFGNRIGASTTPATIMAVSGSDHFITNNTMQSGNLVLLQANTTLIENNTFESACITTGSGSRASTIIRGDTISNCTGDAISIAGVNLRSNITNNIILSPTGIGIRVEGATDLFILNNTINASAAARIRSTNRTLVANNTIDGQMGTNFTVYVSNSTNLTLLENFISNITAPGAAIIFGFDTKDSRSQSISILNNTISFSDNGVVISNFTASFSGQPSANLTGIIIDLNTVLNSSIAIGVFGDKDNLSVMGVNISRNQILSSGFGIIVKKGSAVRVWQNTVNSTTIAGIAILAGSQNISLANNTVRHSSTSLLLGNVTGASARDEILHNATDSGLHINASIDTKATNLSVLQSNTTIRIQDSFNSTINQTNVSQNVIIENSTAGRINFTQGANFSNTRAIIEMVNITRNFVSINSSLAPQLNLTAVITLFGINLSSPSIERSQGDTETFSACPSTVCTIMESGGADTTFNVTGFTSYRIGGSEQENSTITNSNITNSTIVQSNVSNTTTVFSRINGSTIDNSTIIRSNISRSSINRSRIEDSSVTNTTAIASNLYNTTIDNVSIETSKITKGTANRSMISNATFTNATVTSSTINTSAIHNSSIKNSTIAFSVINSSRVENATINASNITASTVNASHVRNGTVLNSTLWNTLSNQTTIINATLFYVNASHAIINTSVVNTSRIMNASLQDAPVTNSTILNASITSSTVLSCTINSSRIISSILSNCTVLDSTLNRSTAENATLLQSNASSSMVNASAVDLSSLSNSSIHTGTITRSFASNSTTSRSNLTNANITLGNAENASIANATLIQGETEGSVIENSSLIRANMTLRTLNRTLVDSSNLTNASFTAGIINATTAIDAETTSSNTTNALVFNSTVSNSSLRSSNASRSTLERVRLENASTINSTMGDLTSLNAYTEQSGITDSNITNAFVNQSNLDLLNAINSSVTGTFSNQSVIDNTTITNSTVLSSVINRTIITNLNITNSTLFDTAINRSTLDNASSVDANLTDSLINATEVRDSSIVNATSFGRTRVHNSSAVNTTTEGANLTRANATLSTIINSSIENATARTSFINSSTIFNSTSLNSTIFWVFINKSSLDDAFIGKSNLTDATVNASTIDDSTIQNATAITSTVNQSILDNATLTNSTIQHSFINASLIENSTLINSNSTIANGTDATFIFTGSTINGSLIINSTILRSNLTASLINHSFILNASILNSTIYTSPINASIIHNSTIRGSNISFARANASQTDEASLTNSTIAATIINQSVIGNATITNSSLTMAIINASHLSNSTVASTNATKALINHSRYHTSSIENSTSYSSNAISARVNHSILRSSTADNSTLYNSTTILATINASTINESTATNATITNSTITNSTITNSTINWSTVINSNLTNVTIYNSSIYGETLQDVSFVNNQLVLTACGSTLTRPSRLEAPLACNGTGIIATSVNTHLDCNNNIIRGNTTGIGINATDQTNLTISTCIVSNFSSAVLLNRQNRTRITGSRVNNSVLSFEINNSRDIILQDLTIGNQSPVSIFNSPNITISGTVLSAFSIFGNETATTLNFTAAINAADAIGLDRGIAMGNNTIRVNSTLFSALNQTAILRFQNTNIINPVARVDMPDTGQFETCDTSLCTIRSSTGGTITYNVSHFTTFSIADTVTNSSIANSTINLSAIDNSTILFSNASGSIINRSAIFNTTIDSSNATDAVINRSLVNLSRIAVANISNSTIIQSTLNDSTVINASISNSTITDGIINQSILSNASILNATPTLSILNSSNAYNSSVRSSNVTRSFINQSLTEGSTITNSSLLTARVHNATIFNTTFSNSTAFTNQVNDSSIDLSVLDRSNATLSTINRTNAINSTITNSTVLRAVLNRTIIDDTSVNDTNATDAVANQSALATSAIAHATIRSSIAVNSTIDNSTISRNASTIRSIINTSTVENSSVIQSNLTSSTINASIIMVSRIDNSTIANASAHNSTVTNSTVLLASTIYESTLNGTLFTNYSHATNASINGSIIINSTIIHSTVANSSINATVIEGSGISMTSANNTYIANATLLDSDTINASIINSTLRFSNLTNATSTNSTINLSTITDSRTMDSSVYSSRILNSSTINSSTILNNSVVLNSSIFNATIINSTIQNENISSQTIINGNTIAGCGQVLHRNATTASNISGNESCIMITGSEVFFDCQGFSLLGNTSGVGINITGINTTVRNCQAHRFDTGLLMDGAINTTLTNVTIRNTTTAISIIHNAFNNRIANQTIQASSTSLFVHDAFDNTIVDSNIPPSVMILHGDDLRINFTSAINVTTPIRLSDPIRFAIEQITINATLAPRLNVSAALTFFNTRFAEPKPTVAPADDGSFEDCTEPRCRILNDSTEAFMYNVTSFTTYSIREGRSAPFGGVGGALRPALGGGGGFTRKAMPTQPELATPLPPPLEVPFIISKPTTPEEPAKSIRKTSPTKPPAPTGFAPVPAQPQIPAEVRTETIVSAKKETTPIEDLIALALIGAIAFGLITLGLVYEQLRQYKD